jgi:hypothetical protein
MRFAVIMLVLSAVSGSGQTRTASQQTVFGAEEDIVRPTKIPSTFVRQLSPADRKRLKECQGDKNVPGRQRRNAVEYFIGSLLHVRNSTGGLNLLIVQSNALCFDGAHNSRFWVLDKKKSEPATKYNAIFDIQADGLTVSPRAARVYPDLEVFSHTAIEGFTSTFKYSRGRYRRTSCYVEPLGDDSPKHPRVRCSKYNWEFRK